ERLGSNVDASAREVHALPLDELMLDVLVAERLDDERVTKNTTLDDRRRRRRRHDGVVVRARDALVQPLLDDDLCRDDVEDLAFRVRERFHLAATDGADTFLR